MQVSRLRPLLAVDGSSGLVGLDERTDLGYLIRGPPVGRPGRLLVDPCWVSGDDRTVRDVGDEAVLDTIEPLVETDSSCPGRRYAAFRDAPRDSLAVEVPVVFIVAVTESLAEVQTRAVCRRLSRHVGARVFDAHALSTPSGVATAKIPLSALAWFSLDLYVRTTP